MADFSEFIHDGEVAEDLLRDGLFILKKRGGFSYGHDAVLLSDYVRARRGESVLDIGTGTGILAILVHAKTGASVTAVDVQPEMCDMAGRSVDMNGLSDAIDVVCADVRDGGARLPLPVYDAAVCNPPYYEDGTESRDAQKRQSVHEDACSLGDILSFAKRFVKNGGKLFLSYPAGYMQKLCAELERTDFALKRVCFVRTKPGREPYLMLCEARKGGGLGLRFDEEIIIEEDGR